MKASHFMLGFFGLIVACKSKTLKFKKCDGGKHIFTINKLRISPDPIPIDSKNLKVLIDFSLHEDVPPGARIHTAVWKVVDFFVGKGHIQLAKEKDYDYLKYAEYFMNTKNDCPIKAKRYVMEEFISIPNVRKLGRVEKFFLTGEILIQFKITKDLEQLSCYHINIEIK
ncbi:hypothetical protein TNCT_737581 [Trichonephila clavata]|uniref:MD-2-related lipid-recognition domain-containing protein n=1 Tax=Trichonephila clavata TaxID=2740835 RepID=A0A8X6H314_TRICU|nr:hypothetical protein TNCT_737581 [Trichonephila clavata]